MKKVQFETDRVNEALGINLLVVNEQGRHWTIFKDDSRTTRIKSHLTRAEVIQALSIIYELDSQKLCKGYN